VGVIHQAAGLNEAGQGSEFSGEDPSSRGDIGIAPAGAGDLDALVRLEERAFAGDRLSRRSLRRFAAKRNGLLLVARCGGQVAGYVLVLMRKGSQRARLYSIAIDGARRGRGIGQALLGAGELSARRAGAGSIYLEVRADNESAIALYRKTGYRQFATIDGYYHDGAMALRLEKALADGAADRKGRDLT